MATQNIRAEFVEETGLIYEKLGLTRMAGRIHGYLMVSDKEMVSFDELTQVLQASKSAISTNVKSLLSINFIKAITLTGDRKTYYSLSPEISWSELMKRKMAELNVIKNHFIKGFDLRMNKNDKPAQWLKNASEFYNWMNDEFPLLLQLWEEHQQAKKE